jgi:integrative and conjugative element protein (TIGR02256 family)
VSVRIPARVRRQLEHAAGAAADGRETGGILLGFDDPGHQRFWVTEASTAGPAAERSAIGFRRDLAFVSEVAEHAFAVDGSQWIGDWHTHPGGPPEPSAKDLASWRQALNDSDLEEFLALIFVPSVGGDWAAPSSEAWAVSSSAARAIEIEDLFDSVSFGPQGPPRATENVCSQLCVAKTTSDPRPNRLHDEDGVAE